MKIFIKFSAVIFVFLLLCFSAAAQKSSIKQNDEIAEKLTDAAEDGRLDEVKSILASGADVNITPKTHQGWTALMAAVTFGQTEVVKYLIAQGADVNIKLKDGETPLYQAAQRENNEEIVAALLKAGVEINAQTKEKRTALLRFAWMGHAAAVKLLLDAGADAKIKDKEGWTAFRFACVYGSGETVRHFLARGADPNEKDENGETPLMWGGWSDRAGSLPVLISAGADVNAKSRDGKTPLMNAARRFYRDEVKILLNAGADVRARDENGWNALMLTAFSIFLSEEFGAHGNGSIRWMSATRIIDDLIAAGTDVNAQNNDGETALILAVKKGNAHFAQALLLKGANRDIKNKKGKAAKDYIAALPKYQREEIKKLL